MKTSARRIPSPDTAVNSSVSSDAGGLRAAFLTHSGELYGYARRRLTDPGLAEEAVQETFLRAWKARKRFDPSLGTMRGWLFAIERHVVIDLARALARRRTDPLPRDLADIDDHAERVVGSQHLEEAILRLRPEQRHVLVEVYYRGRRSSEVSRALGVPEGTVRSRLFYALKALRLTLGDTWGDENERGALPPQHPARVLT
jgi:RNA polymerase sigma-70 factor (ECF subfamily)